MTLEPPKCIWYVHYHKKGRIYEQVCKALEDKNIPYEPICSNSEELRVMTPTGRFTGNQLLELLEDGFTP